MTKHDPQPPGDYSRLDEAVRTLTDTLISHLAYEDQQIAEPLERIGFYPGQLSPRPGGRTAGRGSRE
jgi:hypothetical protein